MIRRLTCPLAAFFLVPLLAAAAEPRQKLYVVSSAGDDVTVIDLATNRPVGRIQVGPRPHGLATSAAQDLLYVTVEGANPGELLAIDPATDKVVRRLPVGAEPNQLAVTPDGKLAYVPVRDGAWAVVDLARFEVVKQIRTGGRPHNTLCSADGKHVFLAPMGSPKKVIVVEVATQEPVGEIPFGDVVRPIALSPDGKRLYAEVDNLVGIEVADVASRRMVRRVPAELTDEQKKVPSRSHGLGVRPDQKEVWEADVEHRAVHVYAAAGETPRQTAAVSVGGKPYWLTFRPDGKVCYVACQHPDEVEAVDTETKQVVARIPVGKEPKRVLVVTLK